MAKELHRITFGKQNMMNQSTLILTFFYVREFGIQHLVFGRKFQNWSLEWYLHYSTFQKTVN